MSTVAQTFYPSASDQDFTATGEVDIRKLSESIGASDNTTIASFSTAAEEIVLDPYTTRSTTGTTDAPNLGWAINYTGTDGMGSVADGKRFIASGTWTFNGRLGAGGVSLVQARMRVRLYRVSSSGARTLLGGPYNSATVTPTVVGVSVSATGDPGEILLEADETLLVSYSLEKTNSGLGTNDTTSFRLNDTTGNDCEIVLPAGVRTRYFETLTASAVGTPTVTDGVAFVTGTVYDSASTPASGATVKLFNQSTDTKISELTTSGDGIYRFTRADNDTGVYFVYAFSSDSDHGSSDRSLTAQ